MPPTRATGEFEESAAAEGGLQQQSEKLVAVRALLNWHREWIVYLKTDKGIPSYAPPDSCSVLLPANSAEESYCDCNLATHEERVRTLETMAAKLEADETVTAKNLQ